FDLALGRLGAGLLDCLGRPVDGQHLVALGRQEQGVLAGAAADVQYLALDAAAALQADDVVLRPANLPRRSASALVSGVEDLLGPPFVAHDANPPGTGREDCSRTLAQPDAEGKGTAATPSG